MVVPCKYHLEFHPHDVVPLSSLTVLHVDVDWDGNSIRNYSSSALAVYRPRTITLVQLDCR